MCGLDAVRGNLFEVVSLSGNMKIDPHHSKENYERRRLKLEKGKTALSEANRATVLHYVTDMERGLNIGPGSRKGGRSHIRLLAIIQRMEFLAREFQERFGVADIREIDEDRVHEYFADMRSGRIRRRDGTPYRGTGNFVRDMKAFWHWHMKVQRKQAGLILPDICMDLDATDRKPSWVYLTEEDVRELCNYAKFDYRVLIMFLFDSGIRSPTELANVRISDLSSDATRLNIRGETSKTFGRRINLLLCPPLLREFIVAKNRSGDDPLLKISSGLNNKYLKRLAIRVLGNGQSPGGERYSNVSMYDFRHSSACYWLPRYKSEAALKYRFGWKKSDEIHYYTELLGMKDTIQEEDVLLSDSRTEIEKRLLESEREKRMMQERLDMLQSQMDQMRELTESILVKARIS